MLLLPGGTPKQILEKLNKDVNAAVHSPEMKMPLEKLGMIGLGDKSLEQLDAGHCASAVAPQLLRSRQVGGGGAELLLVAITAGAGL